MQAQDIPYGYCHCGCGQRTRIANETKASLGWVRGEPYKYARGHHTRVGSRSGTWRVEPRGYKTDCWTWLGYVDLVGYGKVSGASAHTVMYERHVGPVPDGLELDHLCRNRSCVNPEHLEPVTRAVNAQRGAMAKLTMDIAREIRRSTEPHTVLARRYGVTPTTIRYVRLHRTWRERAA